MRPQGITRVNNRRRLLAAGLAIGAIAMAHAGTTSTASSPRETWQHRALQTLAAMPDADAKITAAALARDFPDDRARTMPLMDRAVTLAPSAADIALLDINLCAAAPGCPAAEREAQLRHVAPDNGAFLMMALHETTVRGDAAGTTAILRQLARKPHFDLYHAALGKRFRAALERLPPASAATPGTDDDSQLAAPIMAMAWVSALAVPAYQDIVSACKPTGAQQFSATRRQHCRSIAESLKAGDSIIANRLGLRLQEWNARDAADSRTARQQYRASIWRTQRFDTLIASLPPGERAARLWTDDSEAEQITAALRQAGEPLNPPDDWREPGNTQPTRTPH